MPARRKKSLKKIQGQRAHREHRSKKGRSPRQGMLHKSNLKFKRRKEKLIETELSNEWH